MSPFTSRLEWWMREAHSHRSEECGCDLSRELANRAATCGRFRGVERAPRQEWTRPLACQSAGSFAAIGQHSLCSRGIQRCAPQSARDPPAKAFYQNNWSPTQPAPGRRMIHWSCESDLLAIEIAVQR